MAALTSNSDLTAFRNDEVAAPLKPNAVLEIKLQVNLSATMKLRPH